MKNIFLITLIIILIQYKSIAQPFIFFNKCFPDSDRGSNGLCTINKLDLTNSEENIFLSGDNYNAAVYKFDQSQTWISIDQFRYSTILYKITDTTEWVLLPKNLNNIGRLLYSSEQKRLYIFSHGYYNSPSTLAVYDFPSSKIISQVPLVKMFDFVNYLNKEAFFSTDEKSIYFASYDTISQKNTIVSYSTENENITSEEMLKEFGYGNCDGEILHKGRNGKAIIESYIKHQGSFFRIYDFESNIGSKFVAYNKIADPFFLDSTHLILADTEDSLKVRYYTGKFSIFNIFTGNLIRTLTLPSKGKVYTFDNYPNNFYYVKDLETEQPQIFSFNIDSLVNQEKLSTYSLFAIHSLWLELGSRVLSGDIGVNEAGSPPFLDSQVELSAGVSTTSSAASVKANRIKVKQKAVINGEVWYNQLENNGAIIGEKNTPLELPLFEALPAFKSSSPGTQNIIVQAGKELVLQPGSYGDIQVRLNGRLILSGGEYHMKSLNAGFNTKIMFQSPSEVMIAGKFDSNEGSYIGPRDTTTMSAKDIIFYVGGINGTTGTLSAVPKAAKIGINNKVKANFYVPNGTLWIMMNSDAEGAFIAKDLSAGVGTTIKLNSSF